MFSLNIEFSCNMFPLSSPWNTGTAWTAALFRTVSGGPRFLPSGRLLDFHKPLQVGV